MASLARNYHNDLQYQDQYPPEERKEAIDCSLNNIQSRASQPHKEHLSALFTEENILEALTQSALGKASGPDGIPYEFLEPS